MEKPKTFWVIRYRDSQDFDSQVYLSEGLARDRAKELAQDELVVVHIFQCIPVASYEAIVDVVGW